MGGAVKWISVKKELPLKHKEVVILTSEHDKTIGYYNVREGGWVDYEIDGDYIKGEITHWFYTPDNPP